MSLSERDMPCYTIRIGSITSTVIIYSAPVSAIWPDQLVNCETNNHPCYEASDVRPVGYSAVSRLRGTLADFGETAKELQYGPETDYDDCRQAGEEEEDSYKDQGVDPGMREHYEVRAQHACNSAAGAQAWYSRTGINNYLRQPGNDTGPQVKD